MKFRRLLLRFWHMRVGHKWKFVRNIYGDEINYCGGSRSIYECVECGKWKYCPGLHGSYLNLAHLPELSDFTVIKGPTFIIEGGSASIASRGEITTATDGKPHSDHGIGGNREI